MESLTMITTFTGIGMQEQGFKNSGCFDLKVIGTSDIDIDSIVSYAVIHCGMTKETVQNYEYYPYIEYMRDELSAKNIGYNFKTKEKYDWQNAKEPFIRKVWLAVHLQQNFGDISLIDHFPYSDILTFTFPCTDISYIGERKGMSYEAWKDGNPTRSGLVWEIVRILNNQKDRGKLPKFLFLENVSLLMSGAYIGLFEHLNNLLSDIGYNCSYAMLNAKDYGVPHNRKRVYAVYTRKDIGSDFTFPKPVPLKRLLKDVLDKRPDRKYFCTQLTQDRFVPREQEMIKDSKRHDITIVGDCGLPGEYKMYKYVFGRGVMGTLNTKCGKYMVLCKTDGTTPYIKSDAITNQLKKYFGDKGDVRYAVRKMSPEECYRLMGMRVNCNEMRKLGVTVPHIYKQAGNGIVTTCVKLIAQHMYKAFYDDSFICGDALAHGK